MYNFTEGQVSSEHLLNRVLLNRGGVCLSAMPAVFATVESNSLRRAGAASEMETHWR
jgi:hypothetical protein